MIYHIVVATGVIHGVYGSALKEMAETTADRLCKEVPFAGVKVITHNFQVKPSVGDLWKETRHARHATV
jgi:hypothetical protein